MIKLMIKPEQCVKSSQKYNKKATGFKFLRLKYWMINQATTKCKLNFGQNLQKMSKIEKVNTNIKFCIFKLVYSRVPNRKGGGINGGREGVGKLKI